MKPKLAEHVTGEHLAVLLGVDPQPDPAEFRRRRRARPASSWTGQRDNA